MDPQPEILAGQYHNDILGMSGDMLRRDAAMPGLMQWMLEHNAWRRLVRPIDGRVFINRTIADWILGEPWGGLNYPNWAAVYAILRRNVQHGPVCAELLCQAGAPSPSDADDAYFANVANEAPKLPTKAEAGATGGRGHKASNNITSFRRGTDPRYLARRLKARKPEYFARFERGEFPSVYAAAKAAGIVKIKTPLQQFQTLWRKLSPDDRAEFLRWMRDDQHG